MTTKVKSSVLDTTQSGAINWTGPQRGPQTIDNDLNFDLNASNNFKGTPQTGTLTFSNYASANGQSGMILLTNTAGNTISAAANTKVSSTTLTTISAAGTYLLSYYCDGINVYVVNSGALT